MAAGSRHEWRRRYRPQCIVGACLHEQQATLNFWLILSELRAVDLLMDVLAALMAASASLRLLPPERWTFRPAALAGLRPFLGSPFGPESTLRGARSIRGCHCDLASWAIDPNCWQARRNAFLAMTRLLRARCFVG